MLKLNAVRALEMAHGAYQHVTLAVPLVLGERNFDEVALWTPDEWRAVGLVAEMAYQPDSPPVGSPARAWHRPRYFNRSTDTVRYRGKGGEVGSYSVHYDFLQPYGVPYRLEVMHILGGSSPVHNPFLRRWSLGNDEDEVGQVVHVSYKPPAESEPLADYIDECQRLEAAGFAIEQSNESSYGLFAYFSHPDPNVLPQGVLLKPRVNLRDATLRYGRQVRP